MDPDAPTAPAADEPRDGSRDGAGRLRPGSGPVPTFTGAAIADPFRREVRSRAYPVGTTIAAAAADLVPDPRVYPSLACALNGHPVPRHLWPLVRPKAGTCCQLVPMPGDGNTAARIALTLVVVAAAAAATVATGGAAAFAATPLLGAVAGAVVGAAIPTAGPLLVGATVPPP